MIDLNLVNEVKKLENFPLRTYEKIRYADTDRQGHVNNAVFATLLESGRVELLYDQQHPLHDPLGSFVIASLKLDFLSEMQWPGTAEIGTKIVRVGSSSITIQQGIFQNQLLVASADTVVVHVSNENGKSLAISDKVKRFLEELQ